MIHDNQGDIVDRGYENHKINDFALEGDYLYGFWYGSYLKRLTSDLLSSWT